MNAQRLPVLVGFDGSDDALLGLVWARAWAQLSGTPLRVVVVVPDSSSFPSDMEEYEEWRAHRSTTSAEHVLAEVTSVPWEVVRVSGEPVDVLRHEAEQASTVVLGSHGHGPVEGNLVGSVSHHLAGHVDCPVVVVRPAHHDHADKIVVGVDGSEASLRALTFAAERASRTGEEVVVVHAYHYPAYVGVGMSPVGYRGGLAVDLTKVQTQVEDRGEDLAADARHAASAAFPGVRVRSLATFGRGASVLARMSEDASLVVVGARGRGGWSEFLLGSTSQQVLHHATCPVAVVT